MNSVRLVNPPRTSSSVLTLGWASVTFNLIVLGSTHAFTLEAIGRSFQIVTMAVAFAFYIWFGAPVVVAWTSFMFLKTALADGSGAAKLGLWGSIAL
jgi:hypothetical protein